MILDINGNRRFSLAEEKELRSSAGDFRSKSVCQNEILRILFQLLYFGFYLVADRRFSLAVENALHISGGARKVTEHS